MASPLEKPRVQNWTDPNTTFCLEPGFESTPAADDFFLCGTLCPTPGLPTQAIQSAVSSFIQTVAAFVVAYLVDVCFELTVPEEKEALEEWTKFFARRWFTRHGVP